MIHDTENKMRLACAILSNWDSFKPKFASFQDKVDYCGAFCSPIKPVEQMNSKERMEYQLRLDAEVVRKTIDAIVNRLVSI